MPGSRATLGLMGEPASSKISYAEYLAFEESAELKHEYIDGIVRAMAGGTLDHARIAANVIGALRAALRSRPCAVFSSDAKVRIEASNRSTYADAAVVCGQLERSATDAQAIANPIVVVEVLSPSAEAYDRGEKFRHYKKLASLQEYVLVSQSMELVEYSGARPTVGR